MSTALLLGLLIGMRHALEADHVAAVASLVVNSRSLRSSVRQGIVWGIGHTLTLFVIGSFVILADAAVSPIVASTLEACVGVMLILLGLDIARRMIRERIHFHAHAHHDGVRHFHAHSHRGQLKTRHDGDAHQHQHTARFPARALFVGLMHGLAGSAALIIITVDATGSPAQGLWFIALFGAGSIIGMALLSIAIALPLRRSSQHLTAFHRAAHVLVGLANIALGSFLLYDGLTLAL